MTQESCIYMTAAEQKKKPVSRRDFRIALENAIGELAQRWTTPERNLGKQYGNSLVQGDGSAPADLSESKRGQIQNRFKQLCRKLGATGLPGQSQPWYK
jgi:hypothetical protein